MREYLLHHNANSHWNYPTSVETDVVIDEARAAAADFLNAAPNEVAFGANMTTLTFSLSRALARTMSSGDEIVVTELDHHANVAPWMRLVGRARRGHPDGAHGHDDWRARLVEPRAAVRRAHEAPRHRRLVERARHRSPMSRARPRSRTRTARACSSTRWRTHRTRSSTCARSTATSSRARRTNSTGRTWACCTESTSCSPSSMSRSSHRRRRRRRIAGRRGR